MTRAEKVESLLKAVVMAWDADQDEEFDATLARARKLLGFKLAEDVDDHRCSSCGFIVATPGLCGECSCEDDGDIW